MGAASTKRLARIRRRLEASRVHYGPHLHGAHPWVADCQFLLGQLDAALEREKAMWHAIRQAARKVFS
jgi:hypothetical protein